MSNIFSSQFNDFYAVMEQTSPEDNKVNIIEQTDKDGLSFLRFSTCLQTFGTRNRNRRLWQRDQVYAMNNAKEIQELIRNGSFVGEAGHPCSTSGKVTVERIMQIDPLNCSHRILSLDWSVPNRVYGVVETLDEGVGSPGYRFMRNILQGIIPAFSLRSLVPQRRNADGTIDVIGPGRTICYDRVYLPSHEEAYMDTSIPVKNIITKNAFELAMESYASYVTSHSDKIRTITDGLEPAMESATIDKNGIVSIPVAGGKIFASPELKYRTEIRDLFNNL